MWALRATAAVLLAAFLLAAPPLPAAREAEPLPPCPRPAPALFSAEADGSVLLVRVYANAPRDDEFIEIGNRGAVPLDMTAWSLTDREATAVFPADSILPANGRLLVTRNASSYAEDTLAVADFAFESGDVRRMDGGVPRLADAGDEVLLLDPAGTVVDAYAWGDSRYQDEGWTGRTAERMGRGEVALRNRDGNGAWIDRDGAEDWEDLRHHRVGQSAFDLESFDLQGTVTAVLSPDEGDGPLLRFLGSAQRTIELGVYTFTSGRIAGVLEEAVRRGIRVRVLLDGGPVGGIDPDELNVTRDLAGAGVEVRWLKGGSDVVKRYRFLHAKYAIVDARAAWIGSENFGEAGFPTGARGNRGWSVLVEDEGLATALRSVFEIDFDERRRDSIPERIGSVPGMSASPPLPPRTMQTRSDNRRARLVVGPDANLDPDGILDLLLSATERLSIETFYIEDRWRNTTNPFLEGAFDAARRGVTVRILLDGSWSSVEADTGTNDDVVARINRRAKEEHLPVEARLLEPRGSIQRLHNKGVVVDGRAVLVSSMNWALGSATENREIGVLLEDRGIAQRFEAAFDADWEGRATSGTDAWRLEDPLALLGLYVLVAVASAVSLRKLRPGDKGIKPRPRVRTRALIRAPLRRRRGEVRLLPPELVAEPRARDGGGTGARGGREETRGRGGGPEGD